ncbi:SRPBCC family protein [Arthrobacter sp. DNA4]|uniref:SRPBCC family protein n=1 Tax=Arthrobacter sp. DNA4 TaxID=2963432 RepID=UPI0020CD5B86|nr:SRPBCC family protein [Arthrobacter sp. DNA4]UTT71440.1 SRPBCC family protein [Arthrobacter sp. DNA4]
MSIPVTMSRRGKPRRLALPAVVLAGVVAPAVWFPRYYLRWGATDAEANGGLPGDDFLPVADLQSTRAVTIKAPAHRVWPWLAQMGQGRGGLYSYDVLDNLAGLDIHSADRIHPEWQDIKAGDRFHLAPDPSADLEVGAVDLGSSFVLRVPPGSPGPFDFSWAFVLRPQPDGTTRLLVRERYAYRRWWTLLMVEAVEIASFVMSRRMLQGIRDRAESRV